MQKIHEWALVIALLIILIALAILIAYMPASAQVDPLPTMSATSWAATPTMIPGAPTPDRLYHFTVYLPLIVGAVK